MIQEKRNVRGSINLIPIIFLGLILIGIIAGVVAVAFETSRTNQWYDSNEITIAGKGFEQELSNNNDFPTINITNEDEARQHIGEIMMKAAEQELYIDSIQYRNKTLNIDANVTQDLGELFAYFSVVDIKPYEDDYIISVEYGFKNLYLNNPRINEIVPNTTYIMVSGTIELFYD